MPADLQDARVRPPAVAGLFYPRDPVRLQTEVLELVGGGAPHSKVIPKALIAPHAGYVYPGRVAGAAFAKLRASAQTIIRVVLIGPAHYVHLGGIAAPRVACPSNWRGRSVNKTSSHRPGGYRGGKDRKLTTVLPLVSAERGGDAGELTPFGTGSFEIACLAVGGTIAAIDAVLASEIRNAYALVRPCGHHAEANRGRGFCIFGNVAVGVMHARAERGVGSNR